jgi:hypothetical protein
MIIVSSENANSPSEKLKLKAPDELVVVECK